MQKSKIEWTDYTWNPVTGCLHGCDYCYARRLAEGRLKGKFGYPKEDPFQPVFHPNKLAEPKKLKKPAKIFVCSMGDLFGEWVEGYWIEQVFSAIRECPQHTFQLLTKNPRRYMEFNGIFPPNCWIGTTVEDGGNLYRLEYIRMLKDASIKFASFEPLLSPIHPNLQLIDWVIIGRQTGSKGFQPEESWVKEIITRARAYKAKVFCKDNLGMNNPIQEYPLQK